MKKTTLSIVAFFVVFFTSFVFAQENISLDLIDNYVRAIQEKDREQIDSAYYELKRDSDTVEFMRLEYPEHYHTFSLWDLAVRFRNLRDEADDRFEDAASSKTGSRRSVRSSSSSGLRSNSDVAADSPNQDRLSNQDLIQSNSNQELLNQSRPSNSRVVNRNPNQNRPPNRVR